MLIKFKRFSQWNTLSSPSLKHLCSFGYMTKVKSLIETVIERDKRLSDHLFFYRLSKKHEWLFKFANSHWLNIFQLHFFYKQHYYKQHQADISKKIKHMLSNTLNVNFFIHDIIQKIMGHILKNKQKNKCVCHCVKGVQIRSFFWSVFGHISRIVYS